MPVLDPSARPLWRDLDRRVAGTVVTPGDARYDAVRGVANARFRDARPDAVVMCSGPQDVVEAMRATEAAGLPMSVRGGGHCFGGRSSSGAVIIEMSGLRSIDVDGDTVRVGAGVRLGALYDHLALHGLTIPGGNGSTVGISGLVLGGGLGILGRRYGLACDGLRAAEVVLADGEHVQCDADQHPDLFWALRGAGGGRFGVVTSLVLQTVAAPAMTAFEVRWSYRHAARVLEAWQAFAPDAPDDMAASLLLSAPADPDVEPSVSVTGTMADTATTTQQTLEALVTAAGCAPLAREYSYADHRAIKRKLEPPDINLDHRTYLKSQFHDRPLPPDSVDALVTGLDAGRRPGHVRELDFTPWAGAYGTRAPEATAFPHRRDRFLLKHGVAVPAVAPVEEDEPARAWLADSYAATVASGTGRVYPNFPDAELADPSRAYFAGNLTRLRAVQSRYDPQGRFDRI